MKKFIITEEDKKNILGMYGLINEQTSETPVCSNTGCKGTYTGPEFNSQRDIAHKYSNVITKAVANKLKELFSNGDYVKVNFGGIKLSTKGMGTGNVVYNVEIPFESVSNKCDARTGFAHVGGWNHSPELSKRKKEILSYIPNGKSTNVVVDNDLDISKLTTTPEGLEEYWIQWKHKDYQNDCVKNNTTNTNQSQKSLPNKVLYTTLSFESLGNLITAIKNDEYDLLLDNTWDVNEKPQVLFKDNKYRINFPLGTDKLTSLRLALNVSDDYKTNKFPSKDSLESQGYKVWGEGEFQLTGEGKRNWALLYKLEEKQSIKPPIKTSTSDSTGIKSTSSNGMSEW